MNGTTYPHKATRALEDLEPLNAPRLHERIFQDVLVAGLDFHQDRANEFRHCTDLLTKIMQIHKDYTAEAGLFGDLFGEYLECNSETSERNGQFFTPVDVADMMVRMEFSGADLRGEPARICDPAAGTGRFMLRTAKHYAEHTGMFNFLIVNVDIDHRLFTYCTMNAVLNGIPAICIHGDALRVEVWDAFAMMPRGPWASWHRLDLDMAKALVVAGLKEKRRAPPGSGCEPSKTVQVTPEGGRA